MKTASAAAWQTTWASVKPLQTLAFLQHLKDQGEATRPSLIVAPTSLIYNWQMEAEKIHART